MPELATKPELPSTVNEMQMLTAPQVQNLLGIKKTTLYGLMRRKKDPIPSSKIGKSRRFPVAKLRWWIEKQERI